MDLWIRSQDRKGLIPNPKIDIEKSNNDYYIVDRCDFERSNILGKYETEQRAIEVLDEIQEHRDVLLYLEIMPNSKKIQGIKEYQKLRDSLTYEMPQE